MLRIIQNSQAAGAKSYYSTADYYTEGQELSGRWRGEASRRLGLEGKVEQADWDALCDNRHPATGEQLTVRQKSDRTIGYDFNWHAPKSVSLLYAVTRDERILAAFRDAMDGTMHDIEADMSTRVRKGGKHENRRTGNMAWGEFIHFTARPIDGVPDPHLHGHAFVHNVTWDDAEQIWKAGQFRELKRDAPYYEAVFHSRLAHRLAELGLPVERSKHGWEIAGVDKTLIGKFSRRTALIEEKARELGIDDAEAKAELGAKTRERKVKELSFPELQETWIGRMTEAERDALAALEQRLGGDAEPVDGTASARAVEHAIDHVFARESVVPERQLLAEALKHSVGRATVEQVQQEVGSRDLIAAERKGRRMVSTAEVLAEERRITGFAREGRGTCRPFADCKSLDDTILDGEQKRAAKHIVESRDRVILLRGAAGVGKTTLMREAVARIEDAGTKVFAFAPSANASRRTLREAGFANAETVATLLKNQQLQQQVAGQLIWIDEAGLMGTKTLAKVFDLAEQYDARVLLSGDRRQHGSVERGAALKLLEEEAGLTPAEVKEIRRQSGEYKAAVKALSEGFVSEGFGRLDELGWITEMHYEERYQQLAADYVATVEEGKTALVISPTHIEGQRITTEIRKALHGNGTLGGEERRFRVLKNAHLTEAERRDAVNYGQGDVLVFHQNAKGFTRGDRLAVADGKALPLEHAARFEAFRSDTIELAPGDLVRITHNSYTADGTHRLDNGTMYVVDHFTKDGDIVLHNGWIIGKEFGFLTHGYVVTSYASQGRTVDRVFIGQSQDSYPASSAEQFYVSASRAREQAVIYTDDKAALMEAVSRSDERFTAIELGRRAMAQQHREPEMAPERSEREEMTYATR